MSLPIQKITDHVYTNFASWSPLNLLHTAEMSHIWHSYHFICGMDLVSAIAAPESEHDSTLSHHFHFGVAHRCRMSGRLKGIIWQTILISLYVVPLGSHHTRSSWLRTQLVFGQPLFLDSCIQSKWSLKLSLLSATLYARHLVMGAKSVITFILELLCVRAALLTITSQ